MSAATGHLDQTGHKGRVESLLGVLLGDALSLRQPLDGIGTRGDCGGRS